MKNKIEVFTSTIAALVCAVIVLSCTHKGPPVVVPTVSFSKDILPIFQTSCAINGSCHVGSFNLNDHVDLTDSLAYNTLSKNGFINTASPKASILYNEVSTGIMPKAPYAPLPASQVSLILSWIEQGAKNN